MRNFDEETIRTEPRSAPYNEAQYGMVQTVDANELAHQLAPIRRTLPDMPESDLLACLELDTRHNTQIMHSRALLSQVALQNVAALTAFETYLSQLTPEGRGRFKAIVDAYTYASAVQMAQW